MFRSTGSTQRREDSAAALLDVLDLLDTGVVVVGEDGTVEAANAAAATLLGVSEDELHGKIAGEWTAAAREPGSVGLTSSSALPSVRLRVRRRTLRVSGSDRSVFLIDVTEPAESEALAKLRRLEGRLKELSTISHNINNPLTALLGRSQILRVTSKEDPRVEKAAGVIEESASRISELARELSRTLRDTRQEASDSTVLADAPAAVGAAQE